MRPHFLRTYRQAAQKVQPRPARRTFDLLWILALELWPLAFVAVVAFVSVIA
jgi:hypothetical protein